MQEVGAHLCLSLAGLSVGVAVHADAFCKLVAAATLGNGPRAMFESAAVCQLVKNPALLASRDGLGFLVCLLLA
jgi:hypothetical protein